jgi:hypothetical protein
MWMNQWKYVLYAVIIIWLAACGLNKNNQTQSPPSIVRTEATGVRASIVQKLKELDHKPVEERIALYKKLKKIVLDAYNFENEDELTMYGYGFLWADKVDEAFAIFN